MQEKHYADVCKIFLQTFERHEDLAFARAWSVFSPELSEVCIERERVIGFLLVSGKHLEFIGIDPQAQGSGLGTALLHSLLDKCKRDSSRQGFQTHSSASENANENTGGTSRVENSSSRPFSITLVPSNSDPRLISWYSKHGFRQIGFTKEGEPLMHLRF